MITIKTNIKDVVGLMKSKFDLLNNKEYLLRPVCFDLVSVMTRRIHTDGKASDDGQIGTYNKGYLKIRERNNRGDDKKIIVSFTRQLENDWAVATTAKGYGIGFNNSFNFQKARWVEEIKNKKIFNTTTSERQLAVDGISDLANKALQ